MQNIIAQFNKTYDRVQAKKEVLNGMVDEKSKRLAELEYEAKLARDCSMILTKIVGERTETLKSKIEGIVNEGLKAVFDDDIHIKILSAVKRNKTEYHIDIVHNGIVGTQESFGGGVLAIISLCLRVIAIIICGRDRILFLDESLAFVSEAYQPKLSFFISKLCKNLEFNIVLISHQPKMSMYADKIYEAYQGKQGTEFKKIEPERGQ